MRTPSVKSQLSSRATAALETQLSKGDAPHWSLCCLSVALSFLTAGKSDAVCLSAVSLASHCVHFHLLQAAAPRVQNEVRSTTRNGDSRSPTDLKITLDPLDTSYFPLERHRV